MSAEHAIFVHVQSILDSKSHCFWTPCTCRMSVFIDDMKTYDGCVDAAYSQFIAIEDRGVRKAIARLRCDQLVADGKANPNYLFNNIATYLKAFCNDVLISQPS